MGRDQVFVPQCFSSNQELRNAVVQFKTNDTVQAVYGSVINNWCVKDVTDFTEIFKVVTDFNEALDNWDVSNAVKMVSMFEGATSFDQQIGNWNVGKVTDFSRMFFGATAFSQNMCYWGQITDDTRTFSDMFAHSGCPETVNPNFTQSPPSPFCKTCQTGQAPKALCKDITVPALYSCKAYNGTSVDAGSSDPDTNTEDLIFIQDPAGPYSGTTEVKLTVTDGVQTSKCTALVTVVDMETQIYEENVDCGGILTTIDRCYQADTYGFYQPSYRRANGCAVSTRIADVGCVRCNRAGHLVDTKSRGKCDVGTAQSKTQLVINDPGSVGTYITYDLSICPATVTSVPCMTATCNLCVGQFNADIAAQFGIAPEVCMARIASLRGAPHRGNAPANFQCPATWQPNMDMPSCAAT